MAKEVDGAMMMDDHFEVLVMGLYTYCSPVVVHCRYDPCTFSDSHAHYRTIWGRWALDPLDPLIRGRDMTPNGQESGLKLSRRTHPGLTRPSFSLPTGSEKRVKGCADLVGASRKARNVNMINYCRRLNG